MNIFKGMIDKLKNNPIIGIVSGWGSSVFALLHDFFTSSDVLNFITIAGIWLGFVIAILTGILKVIELIHKLGKKKDN